MQPVFCLLFLYLIRGVPEVGLHWQENYYPSTAAGGKLKNEKKKKNLNWNPLFSNQFTQYGFLIKPKL